MTPTTSSLGSSMRAFSRHRGRHRQGLRPRQDVDVLRAGLPADVPRAVRRRLQLQHLARSTWSRSATSGSSTSLSPGAKQAFHDTFKVSHDDLDGALRTVRKGDADVAVEMHGNTLVAHYTQTDAVKAATTQGTLSAFVDGANQDASGTPPRYTLPDRARRGQVAQDDPVRDTGPARLGGRDERGVRCRGDAAGLAQQQAAATAAAVAGARPARSSRPGWSSPCWSRWCRWRSSSASGCSPSGSSSPARGGCRCRCWSRARWRSCRWGCSPARSRRRRRAR